MSHLFSRKKHRSVLTNYVIERERKAWSSTTLPYGYVLFFNLLITTLDGEQVFMTMRRDERCAATQSMLHMFTIIFPFRLHIYLDICFQQSITIYSRLIIYIIIMVGIVTEDINYLVTITGGCPPCSVQLYIPTAM